MTGYGSTQQKCMDRLNSKGMDPIQDVIDGPCCSVWAVWVEQRAQNIRFLPQNRLGKI